MQVGIGSGRIDCKSVNLVSSMFRLDTTGVMPISEVLTNSPFQNWPVNLYVSRPLAEKVRLVCADVLPATPGLPS